MTLDPRLHPWVRDWLASGTKPMRCSGRETFARSGETIDVIDPATECAIATVPDADAADVAIAVEAAAAEFARGTWTRASAAERERVLLTLATAIETHADELQHLIVLENGKLLSAARREVDGCVRFVRYTAGWATKIRGETLDVGFAPSASGAFAYTRREPVGVVAGIIPWNMPLAMAAWKSVPPLMCGCTVVLKPAEEAPLSTLRLAELACEAGLPPAALNVVTGGRKAGRALVAHPNVAKIAFTGSTATGTEIYTRAAARLARVSLELGGKSPVAVFRDAASPQTAQMVADGIFYNQGQVCAAGSRLYVERAIFDDFVAEVGRKGRTLTLGSGFDPDATMGPLVSSAQRARVARDVEEAIAAGAHPAIGGRAPQRQGYFYEPTVLTAVGRDLRIIRDEVFGPVLVALPFEGEDALVEAMNDTPYGLSASVYTNDLSRVHRLVPRINAGTVFVNSPARTDPNLPFGGVKSSGIGREQGSSMIDLYTELKTVVINPSIYSS
jgi:phenylacetaldehyde dehydrogenase